jgi:GNAT superfamily N-acetyltransferase
MSGGARRIKNTAAPDVIRVVPATSEHWPAVVALLGGSDDRGCWCQSWRGTTPAADHDPAARRRTLRTQLDAEPPAGMVAFLGGAPVGWCGFGPRPSLPRLVRSRTIPALDDRAVWAIGCFVVRPGYRRRGIARALLDAVVEFARASGAPGVEGYPVDPEGGRVNTSFGFVGFTTMFERAGFRRALETAAHSDRRTRWLMRLDFEADAS